MNENVNGNRKLFMKGGKYCDKRKGGELKQNKGWIWEVGIVGARSEKDLYKGKGGINEYKNYRGINLLSVVGKIYAEILVEFIE